MARPREGSVNVNAGLPSDGDEDGPDDFLDSTPEVLPAHGDLGPCLYLGPGGQRCNRRAVEDGFCARHQPGGGQLQGLSIPQISRRTVAVLGLLVVLWPVLADLIRELMRLLR